MAADLLCVKLEPGDEKKSFNSLVFILVLFDSSSMSAC